MTHKTILHCHPDKGGDATLFRDVCTSFDVLKELYKEGRGVRSFASSGSQSTSSAFDATFNGNASNPTPPWEFYYAAAKEVVPIYQVELAKSSRSACAQKGTAKKCCDESKGNESQHLEDGTEKKEVDESAGKPAKKERNVKKGKGAAKKGGTKKFKAEPKLTRATTAESAAFEDAFSAVAETGTQTLPAAEHDESGRPQRTKRATQRFDEQVPLSYKVPVDPQVDDDEPKAADKGVVSKILGNLILEGEIRIGSFEEISGKYGRWMHLGEYLDLCVHASQSTGSMEEK